MLVPSLWSERLLRITMYHVSICNYVVWYSYGLMELLSLLRSMRSVKCAVYICNYEVILPESIQL